MRKRSDVLLPFGPYLIAGHVAFLVVLLVLAAGLFGPFTGWRFGPEWRVAIPDWASLHGYDTLLIMVVAAAYLVCIFGASGAWAVRERGARRYRQERRG